MLPPGLSIDHLWNEPLPRELCRDEAHFLSEANQCARSGHASDAPGGCAEEGPEEAALAYRHKTTLTPSITAWKGASFMEVETGRRQPPPFNGKIGRRGNVTYYSPTSAKRHRQLLAKIRRDALPLMACLTYPKHFPEDRKTFKGHLNALIERLKRKYPTVGGTWKLEFQERGAAHEHLQLWGVPIPAWVTEELRKQFLPEQLDALVVSEFEKWLKQAWYEIVGSGDKKHLRRGAFCERARSMDGAMSYASSYSLKPEQTLAGQEVGRYWGAFARTNIPWGEPVEKITTQEQATVVARTQRRLIQSKAKASHLRRMQDAKEGKVKKRKGRAPAKPVLRRKTHGQHGRKVNRLPKIRAAGLFKAVLNVEFFLARMPDIRNQRPLHRLPRIIGLRPRLP